MSSLAAQRRGPGPEVVKLWPGGAPGAKGDSKADQPTLSIYLPAAEKAMGTAVIVCPGGGYRNLAVDHEGDQVARWLNSFGVTAFMLKYRLAARGKSPVGRAVGYCGRSARSEKADDPGDRRRRTTKPTIANAHRPTGYAPSMVSERIATLKPSQAPTRCRSATRARNAAHVTFATGC